MTTTEATKTLHSATTAAALTHAADLLESYRCTDCPDRECGDCGVGALIDALYDRAAEVALDIERGE